MSNALKYERSASSGDSTSIGKLCQWITPGSIVLELGPATGAMTRVLKEELGCQVTAIEIDPAAAKIAEKWCTRMIVGDLEHSNLEELLGPSRFDYVVFADVLEHLREPVKALITVRPFLKPGGTVIASIPNVGHSGVVLDLLHGHFRYRRDGLLDETHLRFFTRQSVIDLFQQSGLTIDHWDRTIMPPELSEFQQRLSSAPRPIQDLLRSRPDWDTYQFLVRASDSSLGTHSSVATSPALPVAPFPERIAQVFYDVGQGFSEVNSFTLPLERMSGLIDLSFNIVAAAGRKIVALRFDPIDDPRAFSIKSLQIKAVKNRRPCELIPPLQEDSGFSAVNASFVGTKNGILFIPWNDDPQLIIPLPAELVEEKISLRATIEYAPRHILDEFVESESEARLKAEAECTRLIRESQKLLSTTTALQSDKSELLAKNTELKDRLDFISHELAALRASNSWRLTAPLRGAVAMMHRTQPAIIRHGKRALKSLHRKLLHTTPWAYSLLTNFNLGGQEAEYLKWLATHTPSNGELENMRRESSAWAFRPLISIIVPTFNSSPIWLEELIRSIQAQAYDNWELCIADDGSSNPETLELLKRHAADNPKIKVTFRPVNGHIVEASNSALELASGEFLAFIDHDDRLSPEALYEVVKFLTREPDTDLLYTNEDKLDPDGYRCQPTFKPAWSPDYFRSFMYLGHLAVYRRSLVEKVGRFRKGFEGSQDYDLALRVQGQGAKVRHLAKILYHWRMHPDSVAANQDSKPYAFAAALKVHKQEVERRNKRIKSVEPTNLKGIYQIKYNPPADLKSAVIRFKKEQTFDAALLTRQLQSTATPYVMLIEESLTPRGSSATTDPPSGDVWVQDLLAEAWGSDSVALGPKIISPQGAIVHAGYSVLPPYLVSNFFGLPMGSLGYAARLAATHNVSALAPVCLMIKTSALKAALLQTTLDKFSALDTWGLALCLALGRFGPLTWTPHIVVEAPSGLAEAKIDLRKFGVDYCQLNQVFAFESFNDPFYPAGLNRDRGDFSIDLN